MSFVAVDTSTSTFSVAAPFFSTWHKVYNLTIFFLCYFIHRLDVLAVVVEYVPDLSEKLCVRIMAHLMLMPEDDLVSVVLE